MKIKTCCTPFDENSVDLIEEFKFDYLKIASVSSNDWSLLERVAKNNIPKIISTGGKSLEEIDKIVSFFSQKNQEFAIMHCVSIYPSKPEQNHLHNISKIKERYGDEIRVGWSTHEDPNDYTIGPIAYTMGASLFEKHIGINSKKYKLNNYSINPQSFENYINQMKRTELIIGDKKRKIVLKEEIKSLSSLERGVYLKNDKKKVEQIFSEDIYFAFPKNKNQISSSGFSFKHKIYILNNRTKKDDALLVSNVRSIEDKKIINLTSYIHKAKSILKMSKIELGNNFDLEISHHYGINNFQKYGCYLFNCINRKYAKKIVLLLPKQRHPLHKHKLKEETFQILSGSLLCELNGRENLLMPGDTILVKPGVWHKFKALQEPCIFEEVSTTSYNNDSFYKDNKINLMKREERKTRLNNFNTSELSI